MCTYIFPLLHLRLQVTETKQKFIVFEEPGKPSVVLLFLLMQYVY